MQVIKKGNSGMIEDNKLELSGYDETGDQLTNGVLKVMLT